MSHEKGFTLVELAIVMTIIGLLIGGILKGQELLENARVTSTMAQVKGYQAATAAFKDIYGVMPGIGMPDAHDKLPDCNTMCNTPPSPSSGSGTEPWMIGNSTFIEESMTAGMGGWYSTQTLFWIHLAKANLISGINNDVLNGIGADEYKAGSNYPASKIGGGVIANYNDIYSLNGNDPALSRNYLWLVGNGEVVGTGYVAFLWGNANKSLTAAQAEQIDRKMDDGFPFTGAVFTYSPSPDNKCHTRYTNPVPSNSAYSSSMSGKNCVTGIQLD